VLESNVKTIEPEAYGMIKFMIKQRDEDIVKLIQSLSSKQQMHQQLNPICVMATQKLKDHLSLEFSKQEMNLITKNKNLVTTAIFTVIQRFRVEANLKQYIKDLKRGISLDQAENYSHKS
jgi:Rps23 Pro-64 3,4-dihydroxylase Tpa1-like proline 4-hydroxylase